MQASDNTKLKQAIRHGGHGGQQANEIQQEAKGNKKRNSK